jgi:hypothetical protein
MLPNEKSRIKKVRFAPNWRLVIFQLLAINTITLSFLYLGLVPQLTSPPESFFRGWHLYGTGAFIALVLFDAIFFLISLLVSIVPFMTMQIAVSTEGIHSPGFHKIQFLKWYEITRMVVEPSIWWVTLVAQNKRMHLSLALLQNPQGIVDELEKSIVEALYFEIACR